MSLRSRFSIAVTAGAFAVTALATPAVAGDEWDDDPRSDWGHHQNQNHNPRLYKGVVTASALALRSAPNRGGQIIRWADKGEVVTIFCKTNGQNIDGNRHWYLLTDGTWAWGSARYIKDIGPSPRWC
ncbi:SH3 domain-containing protein [Streptomyces sp. SID13726]|uniref:SH3 domain-containing protein n=1 Tax=Streptomyces sp. SID13726 TaxID=2706058 RepID=UPI0013B8D047|nr:SH3 domain-containing protein [Streptomyces sp. SID13726]NEB05620.1 SH3 domain-containing protein [Streptomyces sp. SID13726]